MSAPLPLELVPCLLLGVLLQWRWPNLSSRLTPPLIRYGIPLSVLGLLLHSGLERSMVWAGLLALVGIGGGLALLRWLPGLRQLLPPPALRLGAVVGNTSYFGLPVAMALLPPAAMGTAVAYDLAATLLVWGLGPALLTGSDCDAAPWPAPWPTAPPVGPWGWRCWWGSPPGATNWASCCGCRRGWCCCWR